APTVGTASCQVEHVGLVLSGQTIAKMDDGTERLMQAGGFFYVPPGHDSWGGGGEPHVSPPILGSEGAAAPPRAPQAPESGRRCATQLASDVSIEEVPAPPASLGCLVWSRCEAGYTILVTHPLGPPSLMSLARANARSSIRCVRERCAARRSRHGRSRRSQL